MYLARGDQVVHRFMNAEIRGVVTNLSRSYVWISTDGGMVKVKRKYVSKTLKQRGDNYGGQK